MALCLVVNILGSWISDSCVQILGQQLAMFNPSEKFLTHVPLLLFGAK